MTFSILHLDTCSFQFVCERILGNACCIFRKPQLRHCWRSFSAASETSDRSSSNLLAAGGSRHRRRADERNDVSSEAVRRNAARQRWTRNRSVLSDWNCTQLTRSVFRAGLTRVLDEARTLQQVSNGSCGTEVKHVVRPPYC